jgi:hypothetical protein
VVGLGVRFIMIGGILGGRFALPRDAAMTKGELGGALWKSLHANVAVTVWRPVSRLGKGSNKFPAGPSTLSQSEPLVRGNSSCYVPIWAKLHVAAAVPDGKWRNETVFVSPS